MRYLTLGFSAACFIAAGVMALATSFSVSPVMRGASAAAAAECKSFTSNQSCRTGVPAGAALR